MSYDRFYSWLPVARCARSIVWYDGLSVPTMLITNVADQGRVKSGFAKHGHTIIYLINQHGFLTIQKKIAQAREEWSKHPGKPFWQVGVSLFPDWDVLFVDDYTVAEWRRPCEGDPYEKTWPGKAFTPFLC